MKTVLVMNKHGGPNGLAGREGRDTPADYRRVIGVLNFLKPCTYLLSISRPENCSNKQYLWVKIPENITLSFLWLIRLVVRIHACHACDAVSTTA